MKDKGSKISILKMSIFEFSNEGENLVITYQFCICVFGQVLIASSQKGICHLAFINDRDSAFEELLNRFSNAIFIENKLEVHHSALSSFNLKKNIAFVLHVKCTDFQLKVWKALLDIPYGTLSTYGKLAHKIGMPKASRAVGKAVGSNPIAYLIPCHRVVKSSGKLSGYRWGIKLKEHIIDAELGTTKLQLK